MLKIYKTKQKEENENIVVKQMKKIYVKASIIKQNSHKLLISFAKVE